LRHGRASAKATGAEIPVGIATIEAPRAGSPSRFWRLPAATQTSARWHVSPLVDVAAYHFSWLWVLIPMSFAGPNRTVDYLFVYALVKGANFAHRHYGIPYAYLDRSTFRAHARQLTYFPLLCAAFLLLCPPIVSGKLGSGAVAALAGIAAFSFAWNAYHTYMQKYGILRVYMAKDAAPVERKTPAWVDKLFTFCWLPLYLFYLVPAHESVILANTRAAPAIARTTVTFLTAHRTLLLVPSALLVAAGLVVWLWHEARAHRMQNTARLSAGAGMVAIATAFFFFDPIKVFIAFGFSHAVEYMVFVWAFQRRRYAEPSHEPSLLARWLEHPLWFYGALTIALAGVSIANALWGRWFFVGDAPVEFLGMTGGQWYFYYAVFQSLVHFYMDGFLWKLRRPEVRAHV
jgi:hypothetical protein